MGEKSPFIRNKWYASVLIYQVNRNALKKRENKNYERNKRNTEINKRRK